MLQYHNMVPTLGIVQYYGALPLPAVQCNQPFANVLPTSQITHVLIEWGPNGPLELRFHLALERKLNV